eukprot:scaffold3854_cov107-Isochrysis_galbana.AAC.3
MSRRLRPARLKRSSRVPWGRPQAMRYAWRGKRDFSRGCDQKRLSSIKTWWACSGDAPSTSRKRRHLGSTASSRCPGSCSLRDTSTSCRHSSGVHLPWKSVGALTALCQPMPALASCIRHAAISVPAPAFVTGSPTHRAASGQWRELIQFTAANLPCVMNNVHRGLPLACADLLIWLLVGGSLCQTLSRRYCVLVSIAARTFEDRSPPP